MFNLLTYLQVLVYVSTYFPISYSMIWITNAHLIYHLWNVLHPINNDSWHLININYNLLSPNNFTCLETHASLDGFVNGSSSISLVGKYFRITSFYVVMSFIKLFLCLYVSFLCDILDPLYMWLQFDYHNKFSFHG